jgi:hypothetical protein
MSIEYVWKEEAMVWVCVVICRALRGILHRSQVAIMVLVNIEVLWNV